MVTRAKFNLCLHRDAQFSLIIEPNFKRAGVGSGQLTGVHIQGAPNAKDKCSVRGADCESFPVRIGLGRDKVGIAIDRYVSDGHVRARASESDRATDRAAHADALSRLRRSTKGCGLAFCAVNDAACDGACRRSCWR